MFRRKKNKKAVANANPNEAYFEQIAENAAIDEPKKKKRKLKKEKPPKKLKAKKKPKKVAIKNDGTETSYALTLVLGIVVGIILTFLSVFAYSGYINLYLGPLGVVSLKMPYYNELHNDVEEGKVDRIELNRKIDEMMKIVNNTYLYDVDEKDIAEGIFNGLAAGIAEKDKYAAYYPAESFEKKQQQYNGTYIGIGVVVQKDPVSGGILIVSLSPNGPAAEAGIKADDIILRADGHDLTKESLTDATEKYIMGEEGTKVKLIVLRDGKTIEFTCERRKLIDTSVRGQIIEGENIAYIGINAFSTSTEKEFKYVWKELATSNPRGIIFDLRDNGGGDMISCLKMLDYIIGDDDLTYTKNEDMGQNTDKALLLSVEDKDGERQYYVTGDGHSIDLPIVILTNENSASASEIFTGVMRNYGAKSVGTKTFGKGIVQTVYPLNDKSALKLTTNQYVLPNGDKIHEIGIEPDYELKLKKIPYEIENTNFEKVVKMAYPAINNVLTDELVLEDDNQLRKALEVVKDMMKEQTEE